eukprot:CCRYP_008225-RA/>CCRYP_008225-RA protein AED:0.05 eAED:0.05 QI:205/1/1/1/1/1/4/428/534
MVKPYHHHLFENAGHDALFAEAAVTLDTATALGEPSTLHRGGNNDYDVPKNQHVSTADTGIPKGAQPKFGATPSCGQDDWNSMLFSLLLFKARWGDFNVPPNDPENASLHDWVLEQRALYKLSQENGGEDDSTPSGGLTPDRISVLDTIGFTWNIRGDVFWQKQYDALVAYKTEHGDVKVPRLFSKNPKLGEWVTEQRRQLKAKLDGRPSMMTDERKEKLDAIGFVWKVRERADWNDRYEQLLEFKKENGHCVVPQHYTQNRALGKWVAKQREQYRFYHAGRHSFLTEERIDLLKSLGFVWRVKGKGKEILEEQCDHDDDDDIDDDEEQDSAPKTKRKKNSKTEVNKDEITTDHDTQEDDTDVVLQPDALHHEMEVRIADDVDLDMKMAPSMQNVQRRIDEMPSTGNMNGMGLLASVTKRMNGPAAGPSTVPAAAIGHVPGFPSLPDQQRFFAQQQQAARATMASLAAQANQHQREIAQQAAMVNSQTMADIAAALARQSRFGNGFASATGMGGFNVDSGDDTEANFRAFSRMM